MGDVLCGNLNFASRAGSCIENFVQSQAEDRRRFQRSSVAHSIPVRREGEGTDWYHYLCMGRGRTAGHTFYQEGRPARRARWTWKEESGSEVVNKGEGVDMDDEGEPNSWASDVRTE
jgi:hypothetical protein